MQAKLRLSLLCVAFAAAPLTALAADAPAGGLTRSEARDLKTQSDSQYKARKHVAEANRDLNKGDCEVAADGKLERACKRDADAAAKQEKTEAKVIREAQRDAIKANRAN
ncbi:hypothetical protein [Aquabacterium sp. J223]|uniref:hypothetical protein n=1 Tax=Aquabacterium sp. J223 TaxID=2898431 RepID=UPI0021AE316F|nr:hypothetical protein [Aquabacterium sp. J223]UUX95766.1 hypothetical protein LRS07_21685 [Aquabacterium sp. J223]